MCLRVQEQDHGVGTGGTMGGPEENTDASFSAATNKGASGWVFPDHSGVIKAAAG